MKREFAIRKFVSQLAILVISPFGCILYCRALALHLFSIVSADVLDVDFAVP
jgi:hypothetical protein